MKKPLIVLFTITVAGGLLATSIGAQMPAATAAPASPASTAAATLTPQEVSQGWKLLFDGKSLDGWRGYNKPDASSTRWRVENGVLTLPKNDGTDKRGQRDLISVDTYDRFELAAEWRISLGGNSGIKYFVVEDRPDAVGHEYQIIDDERHPDAKVGPKRQTSALYDVLAASNRPLRPAGEWNESRIIVRGPTVEHWLNGTKVLSYELGSPELKAAIAQSKFKDVPRFGTLLKGHILVQDHNDAVWYRSIKIRPLPAAQP
jgi:hypothetical protein